MDAFVKYVQVGFKVSRLPHPQSDHLGSRTRSLGKLVHYSDNIIVFSVPATSTQALIDYVKEYLAGYGVAILGVKEES
jgi:hypothetical protein